ncbi:MAG: sulfur transferase domain-containing protein [Amaricoccus sp.]|uniref:beta-lactamase hydrolase domain-containing protein n=1 Tax=Amaricoccus sp. TaxID=1872485 RepID=UPI0033162BEE
MDIRAINDEYAVSGQITLEDLDAIAALPVKSIVCHRPDHEEAGQPEFSAIAARASPRA